MHIMAFWYIQSVDIITLASIIKLKKKQTTDKLYFWGLLWVAKTVDKEGTLYVKLLIDIKKYIEINT